MPSPLPGMDPYLEDAGRFPVFRKHLIASLYQLLLPGLVDRYRARVHSRQYESELVLFTSVQKFQHDEEFIEIRSRTDGRLVTLVDVVSIANRTTATGRDAYLATRAVAHSEKASILELDLVTQGRPPLAFNRADLPPHHYLAIVSRANNATTHECFPANLRRRLPKIRLPLAADDRDTVIDLQVVFARAFEQSQLEKCIDYREPLPPDVALSADDREWVEALAETHAVG